MSATRYIVGETYYFARVRSTPNELRFGSLYWPGRDTLHGIDIVVLRCTEHHKVPGEWDDKVQYDGFLFEQINDLIIGKIVHKGAIWSNQYPRASYGQADDSQDRAVNVYHTEEQQNNKEFVDSLSTEELDICVFGLFKEVTNMLGSVKRALDGPVYPEGSGKTNIRLDLDNAGRAAFEHYLNHFEDVVKRATGKQVIYREWLIKFTKESGKEPELFKDYWLAYLE